MLDPANAGQGECRRGFARARRRAFFGRLARKLAAGFWGDGPEGDDVGRLACFEEASEARGVTSCCRRFETVEVGRISGSVGRCPDFDRGFLPVCSCSDERWMSVDLALHEGRTLPPVELYKLGGEYFVLDGNHRVSVARYRGIVAVDAM